MINKLFFSLAFLGAMTLANAEESVGEKTGAKVNDAKRSIKKGAHKVGEKLCAKGDVACLKDRAAHRAEEAGDYVKDKVEETKNKVD